MKTLLLVITLLLLYSTVSAQPAVETMLLEDGAYGTIVQGGLTSGEVRTYYLMGEKGQQFKASVVSVEDNAFLSLSDSKGNSILEHLPKAAKIKNLDLIIPHTGRYKLEISATEGASSYLLEVTLDDPPSLDSNSSHSPTKP